MNEDKINNLYQSEAKDQPPIKLDVAIINAAKSSLPKRKNNGAMWLAAASVALVAPLVLWMTLYVPSHTIPSHTIESADEYFSGSSKETIAQPQIEAMAEPNMAETDFVAPSQEPKDADAASEDVELQGKITVTGSRIKRSDEVASQDNEAPDEKESLVLKAPRAASLKKNQTVLKSELKEKKQRINQNTISDPMMALEWQQLLQYIEQNEKAKALELLESLQQQWPDYDYSEVINKLNVMD